MTDNYQETDNNFIVNINEDNNEDEYNKNQDNPKINIVSYKKIHKLYKIISHFKKGKKNVEESSVFRYLTEQIFMDWIIDNNPDIKIDTF